MAGTIKGKAEEAGHKIAEKATEVGHKVGEKAEQAADWAKEKAHELGNRAEEVGQKAKHKMQETFGSGPGAGSSSANDISVANIREHMDVIGSCGNKLGRVDHVEGRNIRLTRNDSPDGKHHLIPTSWVTQVGDQVHLDRSCGEAAREWQTL